ncbi:unnamed protein product [Umbelopsis vinacea]
MTTVATRRRKRSSNTDWKADFYRNGYPAEVIVIEDSPTPTPDQLNTHTNNQQQNHVSTYTTPPAASTRSKRPRRKVTSAYQQQLPQTSQISYPVLTPVTSLVGNFTQPAAKRRRKENGEAAVYPEVPANYDDKDGHYIIIPNEDLTTRYKMIRLLGQGTFGKVVECWDRVRRRYCAVKVIRAVPKYRDASKIEIRVLNTLKERDPLNLNKCIHLLEWFDFRNHICMVFELLGQSVFDFLKENEFHPFPAHHIQHFARQLLTSVAFVHDLKLIHTDLKPENILLVNNEYRLVPCRPSKRSGSKVQRLLVNTEIRLIDFGSATFEHDYHSSVVSTRHYRAPEIILGMGWSYPCDIWSIGCILVEFFTGDALFQTHDNLEHLAMMEVVLGKIPDGTLRQARHTQKYFENGRLNYPNDETTKQSRKYVKAMRPLQEIIPPSTNLNRQLLELLQKLLMYDPADRISAQEALKHPFFHPFVKEQKNKAYFKRFQVKYRRRREGKTDYYARKRLVVQAKNKYNSPKYRLVVRFTNKDIICQIVYAKLQGDHVLTAAYSHELPRYGVKGGLTNWAAAYATGLLVARRTLAKLGLDEKYEGITEPDGTIQMTEAIEDGPRPFKAFLDVGLKRTSTGSRLFGAVKGASDGGIYIPHGENRFPGFDIESKSLDAELLRNYIYGIHVSEYMEYLQDEDEERYKKQFAGFIAGDITADDVEDMYTEAHAAIREDPSAKLTEKKKPAAGEKVKSYKKQRLNKKQRDNKVAQKKAAWEKKNLE